MPLDPFLLEILVCPETKANLTQATPPQLALLNAAIDKGGVINRGGRRHTERLQGALLRQDGQVAYPVVGELPLLLVDEQLDVRGVL